MTPLKRIIIIGGGFGGVACAKTLCKKLSLNSWEIVLFNRENHMVFQPLLAEVVGASINQDAIATPLRQLLPSARCRAENVEKIDLQNNRIEFSSHDGQPRRMPYDHLVIACGRDANLGIVPGMADHALPLKTIGDAIMLRAHIMQQLEKAEVCDDPEKRRWYLSFIVAGGGFSGVEVAGQINDLVKGIRRFFPNISANDITVKIIHSGDQLIPGINGELRDFVRMKLEKAGVGIFLGARVELTTQEGVRLTDGRTVPGSTVVCTVGTSPSPLIAQFDGPKQSGRLLTDGDMRLQGIQNVWAMGDCAWIINAYDSSECPPTGQFAERQGKQVAQNIIRTINDLPTRPFSFKPLGQLCCIGGYTAVAELLGIRISGFLAWLIWRNLYLFKLPNWSRRVKGGVDWVWQFIFSRDLVHLKHDQTSRVSHAYYNSGDYIFKQGELGTNFYVIERGEVEVLQSIQGEESTQPLAILGPGSFFGEMALLESKPRMASVRARTEVELVVMGSNVFSQVSRSLLPLRDILTDTLKKRSSNPWVNIPAVRQWLDSESLSSFIEQPDVHLQPQSTFIQALTVFNSKTIDFCCIIDDHNILKGILTHTDLLRAIELEGPQDKRNLKVEDFMEANPITVTSKDSSLVAVETMRIHHLNGLPVIKSHEEPRLLGYVRIEKMLFQALERLPELLTNQL